MLDRRLYVLGRTKSSLKLHIAKIGARSWCNHEIVQIVHENVSFDDFGKFMKSKELCMGCYAKLDFADLRAMRPYLPPGVKTMERRP
jgi:hypothetical protein